MSEEYDKRYMKNHTAAKRVARDVFAGSTLHGFDPDWTFNCPTYLESTTSTFRLPDWVVGLLAEDLGLEWKWGEDTEDHPTEQMKKYFRLLKKRVKESQDELHYTLHKLSEVKEND